MDPDEALRNLRAALYVLDRILPSRDEHPMAPYVDDALKAFEALDEWMRRGGYIPKDWDQQGRVPKAPPWPVDKPPTRPTGFTP